MLKITTTAITKIIRITRMTQTKIVKQRALKAKTNRVNKPKQNKEPKPITKAARVRNMRNLITKQGRGIIPKEHPAFNQFYELIQRYPYKETKIGTGIHTIEIIKNNRSGADNIMKINRTDETSVSFHWNETTWNKNHLRLLTEAMRHSIESSSSKNYKKQQKKLICCYCNNDKLSKNQYHVDHKTIPFSHIRDAYLKEYDYESIRSFIPVSFNNPEGYTTFIKEISRLKKKTSGLKKKISGFEKDWIWYHDELYNHPEDYQILCASCNSIKGNK